jgi:hypothetical protein
MTFGIRVRVRVGVRVRVRVSARDRVNLVRLFGQLFFLPQQLIQLAFFLADEGFHPSSRFMACRFQLLGHHISNRNQLFTKEALWLCLGTIIGST